VHRTKTPKADGGLGSIKIPLISDRNGSISKSFGMYKEFEGIADRYCGSLVSRVV